MPDYTDVTKLDGYEEISSFTQAVMQHTEQPKLAAAALLNSACVAVLNAYGPAAARAILADAIEMIEVTEVEARRGLN